MGRKESRGKKDIATEVNVGVDSALVRQVLVFVLTDASR
jgi:hypothetical protein